MAYVDQAIAATLAALSGLVIAGLGVWVLAVGARGRAPYAFAAFTILWGVFLVARNGPRFWPDPTVPPLWFLALTVLIAVLYVPLLVFVQSYPTRRGPLGHGWKGIALLSIPAAVVLLFVVVAPGLFAPDAPVRQPRFGPLWLVVSTAGSVLAFTVALFLVHAALRRRTTPTARGQLRVVEAGFLPYVAHRAAQILADQFDGATGAATGANVMVTAVVVAMGVAACMVTVWVIVDTWKGVRDRGSHVLLVLGAVAFVAGVTETLLHHRALPAPDTVGVWRFVMVAAFAYGIAKYRIFDLELRVGRALPFAVFGLTSVVALQAVADYFGPSLQERPYQAVAATVIVELALVALPLALRRLWPGLMDRRGAYARLDARKAEVYRAALDAALVDGIITGKEEDILRVLRAQLGVSEAHHASLLAAAVAPARPSGRVDG